MKKINKIAFLKNKKQLQELYRMGKQFDKENNPERKAALEKEIIRRCEELKPKLNLQDCSDEEANALLGVSGVGTSSDNKKDAVISEEK